MCIGRAEVGKDNIGYCNVNGLHPLTGTGVDSYCAIYYNITSYIHSICVSFIVLRIVDV